eukprot:SAG22_NODE_5410_length_1019_cov_2.855435_1_plen_81_part_00
MFTNEGEKVTLGIICAGTYHFGTGLAEVMELTAGTCKVTLDGQKKAKTYKAGSSFSVPANSGFDITVTRVMDYICHYIEA